MKERFAKYPFQGNAHGPTMFEVTHVYQLTPPPPELYTVNEYIVAAQTWHDLRFFAFFLHHIEPRLNRRVTNFLLREELDRYDPEQFLDYKQNCVLSMLECLESYDPYKGAEFLTYAHHAIGNALLQCRMMEERNIFAPAGKDASGVTAVEDTIRVFNRSPILEKVFSSATVSAVRSHMALRCAAAAADCS